jgi:hypothetical protein
VFLVGAGQLYFSDLIRLASVGTNEFSQLEGKVLIVLFGSRFKVQGSRFKVQGSRFKVQGSRFKVQGSRFKVQGSRKSVYITLYVKEKWRNQSR